MKLPKVFLLSGFVLLAGCSPAYFEKSADREVKQILQEKEPLVQKRLEVLPGGTGLQDAADAETRLITLKDALVLASRNNRDYQSRKEAVYLQALDLTYQRYLYRFRYGAGGSLGWNKDSEGSGVSGSFNLNLIKWLANGAEITFDLTRDFVKYLTGSKEKVFQTFLGFDLLQPLLQGAGRSVAQEDLVQAERDVVYQMRSFLRYQRSFSVEVARQYFNLLLARNRLENYWHNYLFLTQTSERIGMLSEAGRLPALQADQARQNEYQAYQNWLAAANGYESQLEDFRILLALPPCQRITLEDKMLETFLARGLPEPGVSQDQVITEALQRRLDLVTAADEVEDARRKLAVARNNLRTYLALEVRIESSSEETALPNWGLQEPTYAAGLDFTFPFNKVSERNAYRRSLITLERARREQERTRDTVTTEVIGAFRDLQQAYQSYLIQKSSLSLAERRVESTDLLLQAGRSTTRDLLEAQDAQLSARNALSGTVVNYLVSHLRLLGDAELLELDEHGVWKGDLYEKISGQNPAL